MTEQPTMQQKPIVHTLDLVLESYLSLPESISNRVKVKLKIERDNISLWTIEAAGQPERKLIEIMNCFGRLHVSYKLP
jgi:hypothetical protein